DAFPDPDDPPRRPELPGPALARAGADPLERVQPPDLPARLRDRRRRARGPPHPLRDRRPAPGRGADGAGGRHARGARERAVDRRALLGAGLLRGGRFRGRLVSAACGCDEPTSSAAEEAAEGERPWWRDPGLVVPILAGVAFGTGLVLEWSGLH